jgi:signal transduction histidine kinase
VALAVGVVAAGHRASMLQREVVALRSQQAASRRDAAGIAHDLRAPLTTIAACLDLLAEGSLGDLTPEARDAARRAARASARVRSLVDGVLLSEVRQAASQPLAPSVDLRGLLRDVTDSLSADIAGSGAEITVEPMPRVQGDPARLFRVFANLIQNSLKYARPGEAPCVSVTGSLADGRLEVAVHDRGIGIPLEDRERVFSPWSRGANGAAVARGHGLGLATTRQLVRELGGDVWIESVTDGATIRVSLPLAEA